MRTYLLTVLMIAFALVAGPRAEAADLPLVTTATSPAALYELGAFDRRGVSILPGGTLEIRTDGCWITDMTVINTNPGARLVSISFRWFDARGRLVEHLSVVRDLSVPPGSETVISQNGCSASIARTYPIIAAQPTIRYMSVR